MCSEMNKLAILNMNKLAILNICQENLKTFYAQTFSFHSSCTNTLVSLLRLFVHSVFVLVVI